MIAIILWLAFAGSISWYYIHKIEAMRLDHQQQLEKLYEHYQESKDNWIKREAQTIRDDAVKRSKLVQHGLTSEQHAPFIMEDFNPRDFRFIGNPIDYLIIDGCADLHAKRDATIKRIILADVKTGKARLSKVQREIKKAIKEGRIEFAVLKTDEVTDGGNENNGE